MSFATKEKKEKHYIMKKGSSCQWTKDLMYKTNGIVPYLPGTSVSPTGCANMKNFI